MHRLSLALAALAAPALAQTVVIPNGTGPAEGASSTAYAWGRGTSQVRVQYLYDASHFTTQGVNAPIVITQLRWRANGGTTTAGYTYGNAFVSLSSAAVDYAAPSTTFASNHGPDLAMVYAGPVTVATPSGTTPNDWYVTVPITPFLYDPTSGADLCVEMAHDGVGAASTAGPAHDCATTGSLTSRVYNLTNYQALTGSAQQNVGPTLEVSYGPAQGVFASFSANVTTGPSPLAVQFTDSSSSSAPGGVTSWAWDFNGDSVVDSTLQNPSHVFTSCGTYTVSLTVGDGVNSPATLTRTNYIVTDAITASFTSQLVAPLTVQFTDTSTPAATSWAWDLDGDSVVDSNAQNPAWVYTTTNPVNVTLTASRLCGAPSVVTQSVIPAQVLSTNLVANNGGSSLWTVYFNMDVLNPSGVDISAFDSTTSTINAPFTVDVFLKDAGYSGFEYNPAPWTLVGTASGTSNPVANQPSNSTFAVPLHVPQGSYGVALRYTGVSPRYTSLGALTTVGNGDLSLTLGSAAATTVAPFQGTSTTVNSPRGWAGTIYYGTNSFTGLAGYGFFGQGCPGSLGHISVQATTQPILGTTLQTTVNNLQNNLGVMLLGLSNTTWGATPLPLDLGFLGAPGCPLRVSVDASDTVVGTGGSATWSFVIPNNPALNGFKVYNQLASLDTINPFGFALSHAYGWVVGN